MNASNTFEHEFLKLLFQNIAIANIGDALGLLPSASAGNLYLRLCTNDIVVSDSQLGTEPSYIGYTPGGIAVGRTATDWLISGSEAKNINEINWGECTGTEDPETIRYLEIWRNNTSNLEEDRIAWIQFSSDIVVFVGITPKIAPQGLTVTLD